MIRWLVRKVVKYVLEELLKSDDFQWLLKRHERRGPDVVVAESASASKPKELGAVEVDSMRDIAAAMTSKTSDVEIGMKKESETVSGNKKRSADVMRHLSELGD